MHELAHGGPDAFSETKETSLPWFQLTDQPRSGKIPVTLHRGYRNTGAHGCLLFREAAEIAQFDDAGSAGVERLQAAERIVQIERCSSIGAASPLTSVSDSRTRPPPAFPPGALWHDRQAIGESAARPQRRNERGSANSPVHRQRAADRVAFTRAVACIVCPGCLLMAPAPSLHLKLELASQGSKVFDCGGPFIDLYRKCDKEIGEAKRGPGLKESGPLKGFRFEGFSA